MKLVMTLLVRDEADILRASLEFHLAQGVDEFIVMDNLSVDATAEIAREYERAGVLRLRHQPHDDYAQGKWVTSMARQAAVELKADWVINSDADEFWYPWSGSLKDALAAIEPGTMAASVKRTNFVPRPDNGEPFWRRMDVRHVVSTNLLGQPLPSKVAHRAHPEVQVAQGNHSVAVNGSDLPVVPAPITILHFPLRSAEQFENKVAHGGAAYHRNRELDPEIGRTWRVLYERYRHGELGATYASELRSAQELLRGLASLELVRDTRLTRCMALLELAKRPRAAGERDLAA